MAKDDLKIFSTNRIGFSELYSDATDYIKRIYNSAGQEFTIASPFGQILTVVLDLGRMILYYIEAMITELNIETAYQLRSVKGLATLTGHMPSLGIAARGSVYLTYNKDSEYDGQTIYIKNYTRIYNSITGLNYITILPSQTMQITAGAYDSKIELPIIQGDVKYQQGTGTGNALQSLNFVNKTDDVIDDFFLNVYVDGTRWESVKSILDMTYNQEACVVRPSLNGGVDVFFGTGHNGKIPALGSTIVLEYLVNNGYSGNVDSATSDGMWTFKDYGYSVTNEYVNLNDLYTISSASDVIFGANGESADLTRLLAPNMSRSFVLANATNYKTFLSKLNMFSVIDAFSGFNTEEDAKIEEKYTSVRTEYSSLRLKYAAQSESTGISSKKAVELYNELIEKKKELDALKIKYDESKLDDNIVYLYLIPDINKRIGSSENYFTCSEDCFKLTDDEKTGILNLIEDSGKKLITVDNRIIDPRFARFAINIFIQMWSEYEFSAVKSAIISAVSNYIIGMTRRDRLPLSDIITVVEGVDGVDSVTVSFDADKNNELQFGKGNYGIDEYGDIVLTRNVTDKLGNRLSVNDVYPLFRGNFTSPNGVNYDDGINSILGSINITLRGKTVNSI